EDADLRDALVGVDAGRKGCGVRDLERHVSFPFRLERGHVGDDPAPGVGRFPDADRHRAAWYAEILDTSAERERIGWDDADVPFVIDERFRIELLRIDDRAVDVREDLEFIGDPEVIADGRDPEGDRAI